MDITALIHGHLRDTLTVAHDLRELNKSQPGLIPAELIEQLEQLVVEIKSHVVRKGFDV